MEIKRIGLDLDDVLGNTLDSLLKWYNKKHETGFKREDFYTYKWWKIWGTDKDTALREWFEFTDSSYFGSIPVIQGAVKGVQAISNGRKPVGLTHRSPHLQMRTYSWLQREFSGNITRNTSEK